MPPPTNTRRSRRCAHFPAGTAARRRGSCSIAPATAVRAPQKPLGAGRTGCSPRFCAPGRQARRSASARTHAAPGLAAAPPATPVSAPRPVRPAMPAAAPSSGPRRSGCRAPGAPAGSCSRSALCISPARTGSRPRGWWCCRGCVGRPWRLADRAAAGWSGRPRLASSPRCRRCCRRAASTRCRDRRRRSASARPAARARSAGHRTPRTLAASASAARCGRRRGCCPRSAFATAAGTPAACALRPRARSGRPIRPVCAATATCPARRRCRGRRRSA